MKKKTIRIISILIAIISIISVCSSCGTKYRVVFEYNGYKITENQYYYWMASYKRNILYSYSDAVNTEEFWKTEYSDGTTYEDYFTEMINQRIMNYLISECQFRDLKLTIDSDKKQEINDDIEEKIDIAGGRRELNAELSELMLNINGIKNIYLIEEKHQAVYDYLFGDDGPLTPTSEDIISYYNNNYYHIKYIVFYKEKILYDDNGNYQTDDEGNIKTEAMTEEELQKEYQKIAACEQEIQEGTSFSSCIKKYSEYDSSNYDNGFFFSINEIGTWGSQIYLAAKEAEDNSCVKVEEDSAVYLILKLPLTDFGELSDTDISQISDISTYVIRNAYDKYFAELRENITIYSDVLEDYKLSKITPNPYFGY